MPKVQVQALRVAVDNHLDLSGVATCQAMEQAAGLLLHWHDHLLMYKLTGTADDILVGARAALVEATAAAALGLARSAIFSMRAQIDLFLAWLYFKDHAVELERVEHFGDGFLQKSDVIKYLDVHVPGFSKRFGLLRQKKTRNVEEPYRLLSAHIHSQSTNAVPKASALSDVVTPHLVNDCVTLQADVSEYVADVLISIYAPNWAALPAQVLASANSRLTPDQKKAFFE